MGAGGAAWKSKSTTKRFPSFPRFSTPLPTGFPSASSPTTTNALPPQKETSNPSPTSTWQAQTSSTMQPPPFGTQSTLPSAPTPTPTPTPTPNLLQTPPDREAAPRKEQRQSR